MKPRMHILVFCLVLLILAGFHRASQCAFADTFRDQAFIEKVSADPPGPPSVSPNGEDTSFNVQMIWTTLWIFVIGIGLNLSPCLYPLIPITISYFGSKSITGSSGATSPRITIHAMLYIAGIAIMNSMLGVFAALSGHLLGAVLQNPVTLILVAGILTALAMSMFGYWEFRLPAGLMEVAGKNYAGYFGSLFVGLSLGLVAAPCIGPFVVALLVWVASRGDPWFGFFVFLTLSLGMGLPLFVLALLSGRIRSLPKSGEWMLWVRKLMGWVLIGMAAYFLLPLLSDAAGTALIASIALIATISLWWIDSTKAEFQAFLWIRRAAGIAGLIIAVTLVLPLMVESKGVQWLSYSEEVLAQARLSGKPIIIDFSADWCMPCRQLDKYAFQAPSVVENAEKNFVMIRVDLTGGTSREVEKIVRRFNVRGVPTVVFLKPGGEERKDLRVLEPMSADRFFSRMEDLRSTSDAQPK